MMMMSEASDSPAGAFDPRALPAFTADAALWPRLAAARRRQLHRQRAMRVGAIAAIAVAAVAWLGWSGMPRQPPALQAVHATAGEAMRESQELERQWRELAGNSGRLPPTARVQAIDAALQSAYDQRAGEADLAVLWRQRNDALRGLIAGAQDATDAGPGRITRI
jgi:hypothetical protein